MVTEAVMLFVPVAEITFALSQVCEGSLYSKPLALIASEPCVMVPRKVALVNPIGFGVNVVTVGSIIAGVAKDRVAPYTRPSVGVTA